MEDYLVTVLVVVVMVVTLLMVKVLEEEHLVELLLVQQVDRVDYMDLPFLQHKQQIPHTQGEDSYFLLTELFKIKLI